MDTPIEIKANRKPEGMRLEAVTPATKEKLEKVTRCFASAPTALATPRGVKPPRITQAHTVGRGARNSSRELS